MPGRFPPIFRGPSGLRWGLSRAGGRAGFALPCGGPSRPEARTINYIGSKLSLLDEIRGMLRAHGAASGTFLDVFSGTSIVAQMARLEGFTVLANDWQAYSFMLQRAFLEADGYPAFAALLAAEPAIAEAPADRPRPSFGLAPAPAAVGPLARILAYLEDLPPTEGPFFHAYCEGGDAGRAYFSRANGARCEAIRDRIEAWRERGLLDAAEHAVLVASVLETMDMVANTASVYGAYLKQVKKTAQAPLVLRVPRLAPADGKPHHAYNEDAVALVRRLAATTPIDVLYVDPPYNHRQYHANYHVLETIARWDLATFEPRGKTGLRPGDDQRSPFCSRRHVARAFADLIGHAGARHVLVSYNDEGLLPEAELRAILTAKAAGGPVEFKKLPYKRFRADADHATRRYKGDEVHEFLFYAGVRPAPARV